ncbi:MAG: thiamine diphosphokinase [Clostridiales bacterium]|nr:thiamine diphosphokinase [Clostridiales bacterium]
MGTRIDHTLANINILMQPLKKNIECKIINENNEIQLIEKGIEIKKDDNYKYVSLLPLTTTVEKVTLKGFKYSLDKADLKIGESIGVSNEQIEEFATIDMEKGILILIRSKD